MGPVMPPSKKPEGSGISVPSGLSQRYQDSDISKALHDDEDLDFSLPAIRLDKGAMEDEELTNLNWLHESKNLLKSFGDSVLRSVSPVQDIGDDTPPSPAHSDMPYDAKQNPNCKPPYSFSCLIFMAIEDSPTKRLPVKDIYNWILEHFPYFANAPTGWKNSVRHNLSLNKCFKKVDKDRSQSIGKGSLWCIDPEYRQNLIQALKKTPYHPYSHVFNTPPTSPQAYQSGCCLPGLGLPARLCHLLADIATGARRWHFQVALKEAMQQRRLEPSLQGAGHRGACLGQLPLHPPWPHCLPLLVALARPRTKSHAGLF